MQTPFDIKQTGSRSQTGSPTLSITSFASLSHRSTKSAEELKQVLTKLDENLACENTASTYYDTGLASLEEKNYTDAKQYLEEALDMFSRLVEKEEDPHDQSEYDVVLADIRKNLGMAYMGLKDSSKAIVCFTKALAMKQKSFAEQAELADLHYHLGLAHLSRADETQTQKHYTKAEAQLTSALTICRTLYDDTPHHPKIAAILYKIGRCCQARHDHTQAIVNFEAARALYEHIYLDEVHLDVAELAHHLGDAYLAEQHLVSAKASLAEALLMYRALFLKTPNHPLILAAEASLRTANATHHEALQANERTPLISNPGSSYQTSPPEPTSAPKKSSTGRWCCCFWSEEAPVESDAVKNQRSQTVSGGEQMLR